MKILFLSYYFEPDLSAGSFRATALIKELQRQLPPNSRIDVVTTQPNRYHSYTQDSEQVERRDSVTVHRVKLPEHKNGFVDQALTFRHYAKFVQSVAKCKSYDLVVGTSSRLMTAVLASYMARKLKAKLFLDIRDIFVDTISDVFPKYITSWAVPVFGLLERYAVRRADTVNLVSEGFRPYFKLKYPKTNFIFFTNGIDEVFVNYPWTKHLQQKSPQVILYAGNMGDSQGLHFIVPKLAERLGDSYQFKLIGDGGKRALLEEKVRVAGLSNVEILPPVKRDALLEEYSKADILFLHLNDVPAFEKVLPSKVFEYGATGKAILAGVSGYAADFIRENLSGAAVFEPCDAEAAYDAVRALSADSLTDRTHFVQTFSRVSISRELAQQILVT